MSQVRVLPKLLRDTPPGSPSDRTGQRLEISAGRNSQASEALELRNKLLMYRFKTLSASGIRTDQVDRARSGRFNQTLVPLLSVIKDEGMRAIIRACAEHGDDRRASMRTLSIEAELIESVCDLFAEDAERDCLSVGLIASVLKRKVVNEFERPVTSRYVGQLLRGELGLFTYKKNGNYVLPVSELGKVKLLAKRYGVKV